MLRVFKHVCGCISNKSCGSKSSCTPPGVRGSADTIHVLAEVMRLAYADRSKHLGDPDFYDVPLEWLLSEKYAAELAATIDMGRARPSSEVAPGVPPVHWGSANGEFQPPGRVF